MINWVELILLMRDVAIAFGLIMVFFVFLTLLVQGRHELSSKCYLPWEKEDRKAEKKAEKERKKRLRREAKQWQ